MTLDNFLERPMLVSLLGVVRTFIELTDTVAHTNRSITEKFAESMHGVYVWGPSGVGKSHLLQAVCAEFVDDSFYLPMSQLLEYSPVAVLEGCDIAQFVAIDELDVIADRPDWQEALFHLFNRRLDAGLQLVFAAKAAPAVYGDMLPDFRSRLGSLPVFHLPKLDEYELGDLLQFRARRRGLELSDEVVHYILSRAPRSTPQLMALLDELDQVALAQGRAITIPFINEFRAFFQGW